MIVGRKQPIVAKYVHDRNIIKFWKALKLYECVLIVVKYVHDRNNIERMEKF